MNVKRIIALVMVVAPLTLVAQMKIATVDVQAIFDAMPESKAASEQLAAASQQLNAEYEMMQDEFNIKYAAYQKVAADAAVPQTIKDRRVREIQDGDREIGQFLEKSKAFLEAQKLALETPIYSKINAAIKHVGDAGGYTYIIDVSKVPVVYTGSGAVDLTNAVKKALGVE